MVTRKPVAPSLVPAPLQQAAQNPPYPATPVVTSNTTNTNGPNGHTTHEEAPFDPWAQDEARPRSRASSVSSHNTWNSGFTADEEDAPEDLPEPLRPTPKYNEQRGIPAALRAGPPDSATRRSQEGPRPYPNGDAEAWAQEKQGSQQPLIQSHNPYLRMQQTGQSTPYGGESSQSVWGNGVPPPPQPLTAPPPPPPVELSAVKSPVDEMARFHIGDPIIDQHAQPVDIPTLSPPTSQVRPSITGSSHQSQSSNPWQEDLDREQRRNSPPQPPTTAPQTSLLDDDVGPSLPPRPSNEVPVPPPQPPRPRPINTTTDRRGSPISEPETPGTRAKRQRNEHYQIKHVNWLDGGDLRRSPILTQNANGPCPLLALVNALVLSTRKDLDTGLIHTLRSREQVSLGLLLDAVFEELARRTEVTGKELPDVGDLYSFLIGLHTGMNVNPRFVAPPRPQRGSLEVDRVDIDGMHPAFRTQAKPGVFEETREMLLYSTFDIPLVHGWIPPADSATYAAFDRSAATFEDAQNIQFREEELDEKLRTQGLSTEEQQMFEDIASIKHFLTNYPTQLTDYGLDVMSKSLQPGQIAILFRNDHFSTLYKEPRSGALMTLVTDAGYSSHDEVVWESLVDVNGAASELFSGDFRPVGNTASAGLPTQPRENTSHVADADAYDRLEDGWQTVQPRNNRNDRNNRTADNPPSQPGAVPSASPNPLLEPPDEVRRTNSEQEDHDLALALQLQEEEEDSQRREAAARRAREDELSRQFLDQEQAERPPQIPPRRNNGTGNRVTSNPQQPARSNADNAPLHRTSKQLPTDRTDRPAQLHRRSDRETRSVNSQQQQQQQQMQQQQQQQQQQMPGHYRRRSSMIRRQQSQQMGGHAGAAAGPSTGHNGQMAQGGRVQEQERCVVM
ncbi:hypothetical protein H2203_005860 [Taxawa tesnikishii (nom. ined.)]|nr:hypothetical protein H2203_005860 [Dothideales sp. JES 119]